MTVTQARLSSRGRTAFDWITMTSYEGRVISNRPQVDTLVSSLIRLTTTKLSKPRFTDPLSGKFTGARCIFITKGQWCGNHFYVSHSAITESSESIRLDACKHGCRRLGLNTINLELCGWANSSESWSTFPHEKLTSSYILHWFCTQQLLYSRSLFKRELLTIKKPWQSSLVDELCLTCVARYISCSLTCHWQLHGLKWISSYFNNSYSIKIVSIVALCACITKRRKSFYRLYEPNIRRNSFAN